MASQEERIDRLEEETYFLRTQVKQLDEALCGQQRQLDALEKALVEATGAMERLRASMEALADARTRAQRLEADVPPHYGKW